MQRALIPVTVWFSVLRDGYYAEVSIRETFDTSDDVDYQATQAAKAWIRRQANIFGNEYTFNKLVNCIYEYKGQWYAQLSWCTALL